MELFKLFGSILVDSADADRSISKTEKSAEGLGHKFMGGIKTVAKWGAAIGGAALAAGGALLKVASDGAAATDRIDKLSQRLGMSRQAFQEWDFVLSQNGVSIDSMQTAMKQLTGHMAGVKAGAEKNIDVYGRLDKSLVTLIKSGASQEEVFKETIKAFQNMEDGVEKARLAQQLFGKQGQEMLPMLNGSKGSIDELTAKARELGLVLSDDAIDAGVKFTDTMDQAKRALKSVATQVGIGVMPIMQQMLEWILAHMPQIQEVFSVVFGVLGAVVTGSVDVFTNIFLPGLRVIFDWVKENLPAMQEKFSETFEKVQKIIEGFVEIAIGFWSAYGADIIAITQLLFTTTWEIIQLALDIIMGIIEAFIGLFTGDWGRLAEGLKAIWVALWDTINTIIKGAWNIIKISLLALGRNIKGWFSNLASDAVSWGRNLIQGFIDGIMSMAGRVRDAVSGIIDTVKDFLGFNSPAKKGEGRFIVEWGANMLEGFMDGLDLATPKLNDKLNSLIPNMGPTFAAAAPVDNSRTSSINVTQNIYTSVKDERAVQREAIRNLRKLIPQV